MGFIDLLSNLLKDDDDRSSERVPQGDPVRLAEVEAELERLRPALRADGGDVHIAAITDEGDVELQLIGACASCSAQSMTLLQFVEPQLKERLPWVARVRSV